jgi:hypothetical protein
LGVVTAACSNERRGGSAIPAAEAPVPAPEVSRRGEAAFVSLSHRKPGDGSTGAHPDDLEEPDPCKALAARACELYDPASEECTETRSRLRRHSPMQGRERCEETLVRFIDGTLYPEGTLPCDVLAERLCARLGDNTEACVERRKRARAFRRDESRQRACLADLLVTEGLP